jgi:hypothetical protein
VSIKVQSTSADSPRTLAPKDLLQRSREVNGFEGPPTLDCEEDMLSEGWQDQRDKCHNAEGPKGTGELAFFYNLC